MSNCTIHISVMEDFQNVRAPCQHLRSFQKTTKLAQAVILDRVNHDAGIECQLKKAEGLLASVKS